MRKDQFPLAALAAALAAVKAAARAGARPRPGGPPKAAPGSLSLRHDARSAPGPEPIGDSPVGRTGFIPRMRPRSED